MCSIQQQQQHKQYTEPTIKPPYPGPPIKQPYDTGLHPQMHHPYMQKESQMPPYMQKEMQYSPQCFQKFNMQPPQYGGNYVPESNSFLATLSKINPRMAQSIINDTHMGYANMEQNHSYGHPQRLYQPPLHTSPSYSAQTAHRNIASTPQPYSCAQQYGYKPPADTYNRLSQYQAANYKMEQGTHDLTPSRQPYRDNIPMPMNYATVPQKISPNYPQCAQLEYSQHYQHRRYQMPPDYYPQNYKNQYIQSQDLSPIAPTETAVASARMKQFWESWGEEEVETVPDSEQDKRKEPEQLYVLGATEIPRDSLGQYVQIEALPESVRELYENGSIIIKAATTENSVQGVEVVASSNRINILDHKKILPGTTPPLAEQVVNLHILEAPDAQAGCLTEGVQTEGTQRDSVTKWVVEAVVAEDDSSGEKKSPKSMPTISDLFEEPVPPEQVAKTEDNQVETSVIEEQSLDENEDIPAATETAKDSINDSLKTEIEDKTNIPDEETTNKKYKVVEECSVIVSRRKTIEEIVQKIAFKKNCEEKECESSFFQIKDQKGLERDESGSCLVVKKFETKDPLQEACEEKDESTSCLEATKCEPEVISKEEECLEARKFEAEEASKKIDKEPTSCLEEMKDTFQKECQKAKAKESGEERECESTRSLEETKCQPKEALKKEYVEASKLTAKEASRKLFKEEEDQSTNCLEERKFQSDVACQNDHPEKQCEVNKLKPEDTFENNSKRIESESSISCLEVFQETCKESKSEDKNCEECDLTSCLDTRKCETNHDIQISCKEKDDKSASSLEAREFQTMNAFEKNFEEKECGSTSCLEKRRKIDDFKLEKKASAKSDLSTKSSIGEPSEKDGYEKVIEEDKKELQEGKEELQQTTENPLEILLNKEESKFHRDNSRIVEELEQAENSPPQFDTREKEDATNTIELEPLKIDAFKLENNNVLLSLDGALVEIQISYEGKERIITVVPYSGDTDSEVNDEVKTDEKLEESVMETEPLYQSDFPSEKLEEEVNLEDVEGAPMENNLQEIRCSEKQEEEENAKAQPVIIDTEKLQQLEEADVGLIETEIPLEHEEVEEETVEVPLLEEEKNAQFACVEAEIPLATTEDETRIECIENEDLLEETEEQKLLENSKDATLEVEEITALFNTGNETELFEPDVSGEIIIGSPTSVDKIEIEEAVADSTQSSTTELVETPKATFSTKASRKHFSDDDMSIENGTRTLKPRKGLKKRRITIAEDSPIPINQDEAPPVKKIKFSTLKTRLPIINSSNNDGSMRNQVEEAKFTKKKRLKSSKPKFESAIDLTKKRERPLKHLKLQKEVHECEVTTTTKSVEDKLEFPLALKGNDLQTDESEVTSSTKVLVNVKSYISRSEDCSDGSPKKRLTLEEYTNRKKRLNSSASSAIEVPSESQESLSPFSKKLLNAPPENKVIDINEFDIPTRSQEFDAIRKSPPTTKTYQQEIDYKLKSLDFQLPNRLDLIKQKQKEKNDSLMRRFLNNEKLTEEEMQKVKEIIHCKRMLVEMNKLRMQKLAAEHKSDIYERVDQNSNMKLHLKKIADTKPRKRFRNLYADSSSESDGGASPLVSRDPRINRRLHEDCLESDYLAYQTKVKNGVPKIIIKRRLPSLMQPYVKLERSPHIDLMAKRRRVC